MGSSAINSEGLSEEVVARMFDHAWTVRNKAHVIGPTRVGCAILTADGVIFEGCNVEHRFRSHDVHAEVNAITTMVSGGHSLIRAVAIAAERDRFTPCGACMDWIMQFADETCVVFAQSRPRGPIQRYTTHELMPHYPH
jgi:cytidine deaminase